MTASLNLAQYAATVEKIEKINTRAAKRSLGGRLVVEAGERYQKRVCNHESDLPCDAAPFSYQHHFETRVDVEITGEAPKFAGWTFHARVDRVGESFTLATAPGVDHVSREGIALGQCDHCATNRVRKTTYIMGNETGERVQVGSTCIKDFLGWEGNIAWLDSNVTLDEEFFGGGSYVTPEFPVLQVLRTALASVRMRGFVSTQSFSSQSTRDHVSLAFSHYRLSEKEKAARAELVAATEQVTEADAQALVDFILSDDFAGTSTYVENLKVLAAQPVVPTHQFGILVSAPQAHAKHLGKVAEREAKKASEHVGTKGEKITVTAKIEAFRNCGSFSYGGPDSYLVTARTAEGEIVKTFTTAAWSRDAEVGETYVLTGTVKDHEVYGEHEVKSTLLARVKAVKA
jgi:hypothetical protein